MAIRGWFTGSFFLKNKKNEGELILLTSTCMKYLLVCIFFSMSYGAVAVTHQNLNTIAQKRNELHPTDERKQPRPIEPLAIVAFGCLIFAGASWFGLLGAVGLLFAFGSLMLSIISLVRIKRGKKKKRGKGLALLSLFFSLILTGFALMIVIAFMSI